MWKLGLIEFSLGVQSASYILTWDVCQDQILRRYNIEYIQGKASFLKGVFQRDIPSAFPCVLKVCEIKNQQASAKVELELTDGWYSISASCDDTLSQSIQQGKVSIGSKVRICGAELIGNSVGLPLDVNKSTWLSLSYNQVHKMGVDTKLGIYQAGIPLTPLSLIRNNGGIAAKTKCIILKKFPTLLWTKLPSGVSTFQTPKAASIAEKMLETQMIEAQEKAAEEIKDGEVKQCKMWLKQGKPGGMTKGSVSMLF